MRNTKNDANFIAGNIKGGLFWFLHSFIDRGCIYPYTYNYWLVMRATYGMLDLKTERPKVLLYLHWFRKYSIQTIHKQTDYDQTGLNLDELIWDKYTLMWINSYTITPVQIIHVANNKLTQLGMNWFRTKWIKTNRLACDVKRVTAGQNWFYMP